jgi:hypothetical protein
MATNSLNMSRFVIDPTHLDLDEIRYELAIRSLAINGNRRDLTARLRSVLIDEKRGKQLQPVQFLGSSMDEYELVRRKIDELREKLNNVSQNVMSQNIFMAKYLHLEARLNRIQPIQGELNITDILYMANENLTDLYQGFVRKLLDFQSIAPARQRALIQQGELVDNSHVVGHNSVKQSAQSEQLKQMDGAIISAHIQNPDTFDRRYQLPSGGENNMLNQSNELNFDLLGQMLGNHMRQNVYTSSHRHESVPIQNHLTEHFRRSTGRPITPIDGRKSFDVYHDSSQIFDNDRNSMPFPVHSQHTNVTNNRTESQIHGNDDHRVEYSIPTPSNPVSNSINFAANNGHQVNTSVNESHSYGHEQSNRMNHRDQNVNTYTVARGNSADTNHSRQNVDYNRNCVSVGNDRENLQNNGNTSPLNQQQQRNGNNNQSNVTPSVDSISRREFEEVLWAIERLAVSITELREERQSVSPQNGNTNIERRNENLVRENDHHSDRDSVIGNRSGIRRQMGYPIYKWNWYFTANKNSKVPEEKDLRAFFKKLELYREAERMTYEDIFRRFHLLVKEAASDWYIQNRTSFSNWNELKAGLIAQFTTPLNKFMQTQKLAQRRQGRDESASEYVNSIVRDFDSMCVYDEEEKIPIVINGLKPEFRTRAMSREWSTVQELNVFLRKLEVADELYEMGNKKFVPNKFFPRRSVNVVDAIDEGEEIERENVATDREVNHDVEVNAVSRQNGDRQRIRGQVSGNNFGKSEIRSAKETQSKKVGCFNCGSELHLFRNCDKPITRIFCFVCGAKDVLSPNCKHENSERAETKNSKNVACVTVAQSDENSVDQE